MKWLREFFSTKNLHSPLYLETQRIIDQMNANEAKRDGSPLNDRDLANAQVAGIAIMNLERHRDELAESVQRIAKDLSVVTDAYNHQRTLTREAVVRERELWNKLYEAEQEAARAKKSLAEFQADANGPTRALIRAVGEVRALLVSWRNGGVRARHVMESIDLSIDNAQVRDALDWFEPQDGDIKIKVHAICCFNDQQLKCVHSWQEGRDASEGHSYLQCVKCHAIKYY